MNNNFKNNKQVDLFIFAGGRGTRINKLTSKQQKCMIKINQEPFINYQIKKFKKIDKIDKIFILSSYKASNIVNYYKNDSKIDVCVDQKRYGTYLSLLNFISRSNKNFVVVSNGDTFVNFNFKNFFTKNVDVRILTKKVKFTKRYGSIKIKNKKLLSFKEKKENESGYINLGIAFIKKQIIKNYSLKKFQSIENEIFSKTSFFNIEAQKTRSFFIDIGTYKSLKIAQHYFK
jgi:NDP-sugar pyrophosphorylase family protein